MADATNIIALMELTSEELIDSGYFDDEEEIPVFGAVITFMRRNLTRMQGYYEGTIPEYMPSEFQCHFRMTRSTMEVLCRRMGNTGQIPFGNPRGRAAIPLEKQVLVFVWCIANQEGARLVADRFDLTMSSVDRVLRRGAKALVDLSPSYIKWPNERRMDAIKHVFEEGGFPGVVGVIDGTHISIRAPMEEPDAYTNRKRNHSIQVQVVCDENMVFLDILAGWPGSVHDSRVLRNSALFNQAGNRFPANSHLLGDGGYPLLPWLMIPFKDNGHLTVPERHFNTVLSSLRQTVERSIRLLKGRWRKLLHMDHLDIKLLVQLIVAACLLHNFCLLHDDFDPGYMLDDEDDDDDNDDDGDGRICPDRDGRRAGEIKRDQLKNILFAHRI